MSEVDRSGIAIFYFIIRASCSLMGRLKNGRPNLKENVHAMLGMRRGWETCE